MPDHREKLLETFIDRELKQLTELTAPETLIPRVWAALRAKAKPWWQRSWASWPRWGQGVFLLATVLLIAGVVNGAPQAAEGLPVQSLLAECASWFAFLAPVWKFLASLGNAFVVLARSGGQLLLWAAVAAAAVVYLTCVGLGTLAYRVAFNKI